MSFYEAFITPYPFTLLLLEKEKCQPVLRRYKHKYMQIKALISLIHNKKKPPTKF